uniref:Transcription and mRNA export factor ENY2 n=1 Tax=Syphacia muris TaxID=451379 RepID=A0A0N5AHT4_9BILA
MSEEKRSVAKADLERRFRESGECDRMKELLLQRLREHGWLEEVENMCKKVVQDKGVENVTVENMLEEIKGPARRAVPDEVKRELMQCIRSFLQVESGIADL